MASLAILQTPLAAPARPKPASQSPALANQSRLLTHAPKRANQNTKKLRISCAENPKKIDAPENNNPGRRNMLLGLGGGLYGAGTLISGGQEAAANPIQPPTFDKCSPPTDVFSGEALDAKCCLKQGTATEYRLPPVYQMKVRPSAHRLSPEYIFKYNMAIDRMKRLPKDDPRSFTSQANIHCAYCNNVYDQGGTDKNLQVHFSWLFFPFHRWYLYFYERILGKLIGDPTFALPFWNWDNPKGMTIPPAFWDKTLAPALFDEKRNQTHAPPAVVDLGLTTNTDPLQIVANNLTIMHTEMIRGNSTAIDFMGCPVREGGNSTPAMQGASERGSHTSLHAWTGDPNQPHSEDMGNFYSAGRDPLFYCHHSNVDRMWTLWTYFLPNKRIPEKLITDPDYLNSSFLFYDENSNLVKVYVKDCVDNLKMGYDFERIDLPWIDYRPPRQTAAAKVKRTTTGATQGDYPINLDRITRVLVPKTKKGATKELLQIDFTVDTTKLLKFDVFVNDEDDNVSEFDKAAYAGTYAQVPHKGTTRTVTTKISLTLTDLYEDMDVADDEDILVTLVPRHQGPGVTIGGIKTLEDTATQQANSCPSA